MAQGGLGHQIFKSKNEMVSKFKVLSATATSNRTMDELDGYTAVYRRCFAPDARSEGGASLRGQTTVGWHGLGPRYQEERSGRTPLRGYVLVDDSSSSSQSHCELQNIKTG